ncbi:MAG: YheT family hydrolase [Gemmatimonadota bacterium]
MESSPSEDTPPPLAARATYPAAAFHPAWWARGPHAQTLGARILRRPAGPAYGRERIETPDGDFLDLDWAPEPRPGAPLALILHGLEGNTHRRYVRNVCEELAARGVRAVALNFRGCSGEPNHTPRFYHSGETADPTLALRHLCARHPDRPLGALGFSLGGNVLLKLLGEREDGGAGLVDAAAVMSVPFDLAAGGALLDRTRMGRLYTLYFLRSLKKKVRAKRSLLEGRVDLNAALAARTLREFDEAVTAPLHGFAGADEYYRQSSSGRYLSGIRTPTVVLHSEDDPFLPPDAIPRGGLAANPNIRGVITRRGGHVGFLAGGVRSPRLWGDRFLARALAENLTP